MSPTLTTLIPHDLEAPLILLLLMLGFALIPKPGPHDRRGILCKVPPPTELLTHTTRIPPRQHQPQGGPMYTPDYDLPGRLTCTRKRHGDPESHYKLSLDGATLFKLQQFMEYKATQSDNYFEVRECVLLAEKIRSAVINKKETP